jgi:hypothetical protein
MKLWRCSGCRGLGAPLPWTRYGFTYTLAGEVRWHYGCGGRLRGPWR